MTPVSEAEFYQCLIRKLSCAQNVRSVSGPGRSGAVASVYASHYLKVPWLPCGFPVPDRLRPHLIIDTAAKTGATLRKAARRVQADHTLVVFNEPPRVKFWYEDDVKKLGKYNGKLNGVL